MSGVHIETIISDFNLLATDAEEEGYDSDNNTLITFEQGLELFQKYGIKVDPVVLKKKTQFFNVEGRIPLLPLFCWIRGGGLSTDHNDWENNNFYLNRDELRHYRFLKKLSDYTGDNYTSYSSQSTNKKIEVSLGNPYVNPQTTAHLRVGVNSSLSQDALTALPSYTPNNSLYFYIIFKSSEPYQLKSVLEDLVGLLMDKVVQAHQKICHLFGEATVEVGVRGDQVVVGWNIPKSLNLKIFEEIFSLFASSVIRNEFVGEVKLEFEDRLEDLIDQEPELNSLKFKLTCDVSCSNGDQQTIRKLVRWLLNPYHARENPEQGFEKVKPEHLPFDVIYTMLKEETFSKKFETIEDLKQEDKKLGDLLEQEKIPIRSVFKFIQEKLNNYKALLQKYESIQILLDNLEKWGSNQVSIGVSHASSTIELQLSATDIGNVYRKIIS